MVLCVCLLIMSIQKGAQTNKRYSDTSQSVTSSTEDLRFYDPLAVRSYEPKVEYTDVRDTVVDERAKTIFNHRHQGSDGYRINLADLAGFFQLVTVAPTGTPKTFWDSVKLYDVGGVYRLYLYVNGSWRLVVLT